MQRARQVEIRKLFKNLRSDDWKEVFEAGTTFYRYDDAPFKPLITVLKKANNAHNREFAAYGLISFLLRAEVRPIERNKFVKQSDSARRVAEQTRKTAATILKALVETVNYDKSPLVRAQALEALGMSITARKPKHRLHTKIENAVLSALADESEEVRFWACYAAGQSRMKNALPQLRHLAENDKALAQMWYVAEEASDAIKWIHKLPTKHRKPISSRKNKSFIKYYFEKVLEKRATKRERRVV